MSCSEGSNFTCKGHMLFWCVSKSNLPTQYRSGSCFTFRQLFQSECSIPHAKTILRRFAYIVDEKIRSFSSKPCPANTVISSPSKRIMEPSILALQPLCPVQRVFFIDAHDTRKRKEYRQKLAVVNFQRTDVGFGAVTPVLQKQRRKRLGQYGSRLQTRFDACQTNSYQRLSSRPPSSRTFLCQRNKSE